jgi:hypothetical protein
MEDHRLTVNHYSSARPDHKGRSRQQSLTGLSGGPITAISTRPTSKKTYEFGKMGVAEETCSEISRCLKDVHLEAHTDSTSVI